MKILFIARVFYPQIGGIEINSEILARHFVHFGAEVHLVTATDTDAMNDDNTRFPFCVIRNPNIKQLLKEYLWTDAVFVNHLTLRMTWPLFFLKKKHVIAIRGLMDDNTSILYKIKRWRLKKADTVIAVSEKVRAIIYEKAIVIGNPYRSDLFKIDAIGKREKDFVFLGRLVSEKGCDMAIEVLHLLHQRKQHKYNLTIIGNGPELENIVKQINQSELNNYVSFTGTLKGPDIAKCLNQHNYLFVPSRCVEGFGNVALEGMACGCLPIVSDDSGLVDAVGDAGIVFERNNLQSMYAKLNEVLENPLLEKEKRDNAISHLKNHQPEFVAKQYYDIIQNIVN